MLKNTLRHNTSLLVRVFILLLPILVSRCGKDEFVDTSIPIIESYVVTSIDCPELTTSLKNNRPYVFNKGGYIEELGATINSIINYNELQSDTTTLLIYRNDVDYPVKNMPIYVHRLSDGGINLSVTYEVDKNHKEYDELYKNIICVKVPKILNLKTFSYSCALTTVY